MLGRNRPAVSELDEKPPEKPVWWRRRSSHLALAGALAIGAVTADTISHDSSSARALRASTTTSTPSRENLNTKPQLSVSDEARMRHDAEAERERAHLLKVISTPPLSWYLEALAANETGYYTRLVKCESGNNWQNPNYGGLGNKYWRQWMLPGMPYRADWAPWYEQIVVAERIRWDPRNHPGSFRYGKWACADPQIHPETRLP